MRNVPRITQLWLYIINLLVLRVIITARLALMVDFPLTGLKEEIGRGDFCVEEKNITNQTDMIVMELEVYLKNYRQVLKEKSFAVKEVVKASSIL